MAKSQNDLDAKFNFGAGGLKQAQRPSGGAAKPLALDEAQRKAANEARGFDPYNTSGSFDRKKHWARVGKR
jgi:hypothetical protein